ncbi:MAG: DUF4097 family beta strand repeat-containing protein [Clostridiaceae bacterium]
MRAGGIIRIIVGLVIALVLTAFLVTALSGQNLFERLGWDGDWSGFPFYYRSNTQTSVDDGSTVVSDTESIPAADINEIKIDWVAGSVEIRVGEGDEITFYETANRELTDAQKMRYTLSESGQLKIKYCADMENVFDWFNSASYNMPSKALVITVPASMLGSLDRLDIEVVSAEVTVDGVYGTKTAISSVSGGIQALNLTCKELDLDSTSGKVACENCTADKMDASSVSGSIVLDGVFQEVKTENVSGSTHIACATQPDDIDADSVSGSITILLPENAGFIAQLDTVSGGLSCEFSGTMSDKMVVVGDGSAKYSFETVSGSIHIEQYE